MVEGSVSGWRVGEASFWDSGGGWALGVTMLLAPVGVSGGGRDPNSLWGYQRQVPCSRLGHPQPQKRVQEKSLETRQRQEEVTPRGKGGVSTKH